MTLLEALITTALFSFVVAGTYSLYTTLQGTLTRGEVKTDLQQNARVGLNLIVQDLRNIGYDPENRIPSLVSTSPPFFSIRAAASDCISFVTYMTDDGGVPRTVQVTYDISGTVIRRRQDSWSTSTLTFQDGSAQPLVELASLLKFTYYDRFGGILTTGSGLTAKCPAAPASTNQPASQLSYAQMRYINRIGVTVRTRDLAPMVNPEYYTLTSDVSLRNR